MLLDAMICQNTVKGWRVVGFIILIVKILVPIIIIVTSVVPVFNALVKGNADETIKSWKQIARKIAAGVIVFLIPGLIEASVRLFAGKEFETEDAMICVTCFSNPNGEDCMNAVRNYDNMEEEEVTKVKEEKEGKIDEQTVEGGSVDTSRMGTGGS